MKYDVICIGGGLNYVGAILLARAGKQVLLIEKDLKHMGGTCLNNGCIPSKNLFHRTKTVFEATEEIYEGSVSLNLKALNTKMYAHIATMAQGIVKQCQHSGVEVLEGEAVITGEHTVSVADTMYEGDTIIMATGAMPFIPEGIEIDGTSIITSDEVLKLEDFPKEIYIYGAGAIGLEFASYFAINGVATYLMYRHEHISAQMHPKVMNALETQLKDIGVTLMPNTTIVSANSKNHRVHIQVKDTIFQTEILLVTTGRTPNVSAVATTAIAISNNAIETNAYFQTTVESIYAIGDCNGKLKLAHSARKQSMNVARQLLGEQAILNLHMIPKFMFCMPLSYATIGEKGDKEVVLPLSNLGISSAVKGTKNGLMVLYADADDFITGAELLIPDAEETIAVLSAILAGEMDKKTLLKATFAHPTFSEILDYATRKLT